MPNFPESFRAEVDSIAPSHHIDLWSANTVMRVMHDRGDPLIPVGESRRMVRALQQQRPDVPVYYTETDIFRHVRPDAETDLKSMLAGAFQLYRHMYPHRSRSPPTVPLTPLEWIRLLRPRSPEPVIFVWDYVILRYNIAALRGLPVRAALSAEVILRYETTGRHQSARPDPRPGGSFLRAHAGRLRRRRYQDRTSRRSATTPASGGRPSSAKSPRISST